MSGLIGRSSARQSRTNVPERFGFPACSSSTTAAAAVSAAAGRLRRARHACRAISGVCLFTRTMISPSCSGGIAATATIAPAPRRISVTIDAVRITASPPIVDVRSPRDARQRPCPQNVRASRTSVALTDAPSRSSSARRKSFIASSCQICSGNGSSSRSGGESRPSVVINSSGNKAAALSQRDAMSPARPMIRARAPPAHTPAGIADETTLPARISAPSPIDPPRVIVTRLPIRQPAPIVTGRVSCWTD